MLPSTAFCGESCGNHRRCGVLGGGDGERRLPHICVGVNSGLQAAPGLVDERRRGDATGERSARMPSDECTICLGTDGADDAAATNPALLSTRSEIGSAKGSGRDDDGGLG